MTWESGSTCAAQGNFLSSHQKPRWTAVLLHLTHEKTLFRVQLIPIENRISVLFGSVARKLGVYQDLFARTSDSLMILSRINIFLSFTIMVPKETQKDIEFFSFGFDKTFERNLLPIFYSNRSIDFLQRFLRASLPSFRRGISRLDPDRLAIASEWD